MTIGLPPVAADQPTFYMPRTSTTAEEVDEEDVPFSPAVQPTLSPPVSHKVPCAIEYFDAAGKIENFGVIVPSRIEVTLLDQDYDVVKGFEYVTISGDRYFYKKTEPALGLG